MFRQYGGIQYSTTNNYNRSQTGFSQNLSSVNLGLQNSLIPMTNLDLSNNSVINVNAILFSDGSILTGAGSIGSNYLAYPNAQGTENMQDVNVNGTLDISTGGLTINPGTVNLIDGLVTFTNVSSSPLSSATQPPATDSSTIMPTTAWTQSAISLSSSLLLSGNNTWSGTNNFSVSFPTCSVAIPANTDSSTKLATTAWTQSAITNGLTGYAKLANNQTFTGTNTFSLQTTFSGGLISNNTMYSQNTGGATQYQFTDVSHSTIGTMNLNNNIFTFKSGGVNGTQNYQMNDSSSVTQTVLSLNYATTILNTANPLQQNATMPASTDASNKTPTTAWVQSAISSSSSLLLNTNNIWTGTNNYSVSFPTCSVAIPANTDSSTKLATTAWTQSAITNGLTGYAKLANNQTFAGINTFSQQTVLSNGLLSSGPIYLQSPANTVLFQVSDTTNSTNGTLQINNNNFIWTNTGSNGFQKFKMYDSVGNLQNVLVLNYASPSLNSTNPLTQSATMPAYTDSSTYVPTTAWTQGAISSAITGLPGVFILSSNNTATGQNIFTNTTINTPINIQNISAPNYSGKHFVASSVSTYNTIVTPNDYVVFADSSLGLGLGTLTLTTHSANSVGIKISGSAVSVYGGPLTMNPLNVVAPSSIDQIGYQIITPQSSMNAWTTNATTVLYTWGPFGSTYPYGLYCFEAKITTTGNNNIIFISNTNSPTLSQSFAYGVSLSGAYNANLSVMIPVYSSQSIYLCAQASPTFIFQTYSTCTMTRIG